MEISSPTREVVFSDSGMIITSVELLNYRNYGQLHMELSSKTNILYGDNARERLIFWKRFMCAVRQNPIGDLRIKRLSDLEKKRRM